jgi:hypothetical protein
MGAEHPMFGGFDRPGIPRIIPEPIKVGQVKISTVHEEGENLMEDAFKRIPLTALSQERKPLSKKSGYSGCRKISGHQREPGTTGQFVGCGLDSIDLGLDGIRFWSHHVLTSWVYVLIRLSHYTTWRYFFYPRKSLSSGLIKAIAHVN